MDLHELSYLVGLYYKPSSHTLQLLRILTESMSANQNCTWPFWHLHDVDVIAASLVLLAFAVKFKWQAKYSNSKSLQQSI